MIQLVEPLTHLRDVLDRAQLALTLDGAAEAAETRTELSSQLVDYVLPRIGHLDAPLLVVLGGSTGSGKSTITNSLVDDNVSLAGVIRPSTRTPVLVTRSADHDWFERGGVLPTLPRSTGVLPSGGGLHLVRSDALPPGLALLDAPDIDSVEIANHELAAQLLGAADAWLFVTTASRYADAVPWEYLRRARERSVALAVVINRVPSGAEADVVEHLAAMLDERGFTGVALIPIAEHIEGLDDGRLRGGEIAAVQQWLGDLVRDDSRRDELVVGTITGVLDSLPERVRVVADAIDDQREAIEALRRVSHDEYERELTALDDELGSGALLRGEVLDRWREHVGTSAVMERLQQGVGRIRDRLRAIVSRSSVDVAQTRDQLGSNLEVLVRNHADRAALATVERWERSRGGEQVLETAERGIDRPSASLQERLTAELDEWHDDVLRLVHERAGNKLAVARVVSLGLNGVSVGVMIAVFSSTGGLTGTEAGVAAGTAAVNQTLLAAIFGDSALRELVRAVRNDLRLRLAGVFEVERSRFDQLLATHTSPVDGTQLTEPLAALVRARRA